MDPTQFEVFGFGDLEAGQSWDDPMTLSLTRRQWSIVLAILTGQLQEIETVFDQMRAQAKQGDMIAMAMFPHIRSTAKIVQSIAKEIGTLVAPETMAIIAEIDTFADQMAQRMMERRDGTD